MGDERLVEVITGVGGGAAITAIAWSLLFFVWRRYEVANTARIAELIKRADECEKDRLTMRSSINSLHHQMHDIQDKSNELLLSAVKDVSKALSEIKPCAPHE